MSDQCADTVVIVVPGDAAGDRVDRVLAAKVPTHSRSALKRLIDNGCLTLDERGGTVLEPSHRVKAGDRLVLRLPPPDDPEPLAENIPLDVLFEDDHLIVVDKPAGLVVHPAPGNPGGTLVNALIGHCGSSLKGIGGVRRPGIVHRLDKDTSGVMVAAKTGAAHEGLTGQFAARTIERSYAAFVWGVPFPPDGRIEAGIGRSRGDRKKMAVLRTGGRPAATLYSTEMAYGACAARLDCRLVTGRTHQIRVHLTYRGHPVIGDPVYGGRATQSRMAALPGPAKEVVAQLGRQALHARSLGFVHPVTSRSLVFRSEIPFDLQRLEESLGGGGN